MSDRDVSDEQIESLLASEEESIHESETIVVKGASGVELFEIYRQEATWFENNLKRYMEEYRFENIADLQDLDRLLGLELLSYRYAHWMIRGVDYDGLSFDEKAIRDHKNKMDTEIRLIKAHMGMNRKSRVESEQQSVSEYLSELLRRAREFGVHRDTQIAKALDLMAELKKLVGLHDRTDDEERTMLGVHADQIVSWIRDVAIPEYDAIDDAFRKNQRLWIKRVG